MRKAVMLEVRLWIEGEDEPAHDFVESCTTAVREIIAAGAARRPELTVKVRAVRERS
ncbi:MAG TPA: hypothetical protein VJU87_13195 [Gemmatimonadaceae bacterium]|nr:hypothetical protein [Gemmatimonadaceae bacterium]